VAGKRAQSNEVKALEVTSPLLVILYIRYRANATECKKQNIEGSLITSALLASLRSLQFFRQKDTTHDSQDWKTSSLQGKYAAPTCRANFVNLLDGIVVILSRILPSSRGGTSSFLRADVTSLFFRCLLLQGGFFQSTSEHDRQSAQASRHSA